MLYPLSCKDILETTTLTLSTSTPQQKQRAPPFFLRHAPWSARCAKRCLVACRSRRCHSSVTGIPEGLIVPSHDLKGKTIIRVPWGHSHGQLKHTLAEIYLRISGWWKTYIFFVSFVCCNISESNFISDDGMVPSTRFQSIGWNETHVELTTFVFLQSQFLSSNRTKQLPFVGRKKTEGYLLLTSTFQKQVKNNRTKKKIQKHFPFPMTYSTSLYFSPKFQEIPEFWVPRQPMICPAYSSCWSQRWCRRYLVAAWELWRNNE